MINHYRLALIGGKNLAYYTIADKVWSVINTYSIKNFKFSLVPLDTKDDLLTFMQQFKNDSSFLGFNVALPWKNEITNYVNKNYFVNPELPLVNTVFKFGNEIHSCNTDILGIACSLGNNFFEEKKKILILGAGGAGLPTGQYISELNKSNSIFYYTLHPKDKKHTTNSVYITSYNELKKHTFDLIINATPLGKLNLHETPNGFHTPIDLTILKNIVHRKTVIQEMNYFPINTLFLELANELELKTIPGYYMLVYQAIASFKKYFHQFNHELPTTEILEKIHKIIQAEEQEIYSKHLI